MNVREDEERDQQRFAELYPSLRRLAAVAVTDADPDDIVQEALAGTLARRALGDIDDLGAYLRTAVLNVARNHRRAAARRRRFLDRQASTTPHTADVYPSDLAELQRLSADDRALLFLTVVERHTYAEAAAVLGCREDAARARARRALHRLRTVLAEEDAAVEEREAR